jgi:ribonuclease P protein component
VKRRYRLRDQERFKRVRQAGASYAHPYLVLYVLPNGLDISRSGFVTSRRIGKAIVRNRARRRMSEAVRLVWDLVEPGWDMVWIARPAINEAEFTALQQASVRLLRRAGILQTGHDPTIRERSLREAGALPVGSGSGTDLQL